jgi:hypothetical protein
MAYQLPGLMNLTAPALFLVALVDHDHPYNFPSRLDFLSLTFRLLLLALLSCQWPHCRL